MTPTQAALKYFRDNGWEIDIGERFIKTPKGGFKKDLFGFGDLIAYHTGKKETALIQVTDETHMANRRNKILEERRAAEWLHCGNKIFLCLLYTTIHKTKKGKNPGKPRKRFSITLQEINI